MKNITRYFDVINNSLFMTTGNLDYDRITEALIALSNYTYENEIDDEFMWDLGECGSCTLADLITGAYWHYTEWHSGQYSKGYEALSALGQLFSPGMSSVEEENEAYQQLNQMAGEEK